MWQPVADSEVTRGLSAMIVFNGLHDYADCRLCRQVPDAASASVPLTYDQLISMQEAMQLAWDGFGTRYQSDQTAARMQRLDNWIGEMLTQMRGEATDE